MDALFGDATTAMPTPNLAAETGSLMSVGSPLYVSGGGPSNAIPGLDIDPPHVNIQNGKPQYGSPRPGVDEEDGEGMGGWISRMVSRGKGSDSGSILSGSYKPVDQED